MVPHERVGSGHKTIYTAAGLQLRLDPEVMPQALHHLELQVDHNIQNCLQHTHQSHYLI